MAWLIVLGVLIAPAVIAVVIVAWACAAFLVEGWHCRHPSMELVERFGPREATLVDEISEWLRRQ